ncbi:MAG: hypothetical protein ACRDVC_11025 [Acidimicrobiales bacterium]
MTLRVRPYNEADEAVAVAIHQAMLVDDFYFLLFWEPSMSWSAYLQSIEDGRLSPRRIACAAIISSPKLTADGSGA